LEYTENHDDVIVIATTVIFAQGINLKRLHYVMLYSFSKSYTTIVQSIGRSLRKHDTKDMAVFLDINDNFRYSKEFYKKRCEFYKRENIPIDEVHFNL
jgi:superfamily II DNA or RNA helicase